VTFRQGRPDVPLFLWLGRPRSAPFAMMTRCLGQCQSQVQVAGLHKLFAGCGCKTGEFFRVKAPFPAPSGGHEWSGLTVTRWTVARLRDFSPIPFHISRSPQGRSSNSRGEDVFASLWQSSIDGRDAGKHDREILKKMVRGTDSEPAASTARLPQSVPPAWLGPQRRGRVTGIPRGAW